MTEKAAKKIRFHMRFPQDPHHKIVCRAAKKAGLSLNAWLVDRSLAQARKELKAA
jgi:predicted HicB family RNase H-like nuclease